MPGPWLTDNEILEAVADLQKLATPADLPAYWLKVVRDANQAAYDDITAALLGRGFTAADLDRWRQRRTYNLDLALFWALTKGGMLSAFSDQQLAKLDRRKDLLTATLLDDAGGVIPPGGGADPDSNDDGATDTWGGAGIAGGRISQDGFRVTDRTVF